MPNKMGLYVIFDRVAEDSGPIFEAINDGVAHRNYRQFMLKVSPVDQDAYVLYRVGVVNHGSMLVDAEATPVEIVIPEAVARE